MKLSKKLTLWFSIAFSVLTGFTLLLIYLLAVDNRNDTFNQKLKDRTLTTFRMWIAMSRTNENLLQIYDRFTINSLYEEKILIYDEDLNLIYSSLDDTPVFFPDQLLKDLKAGEEETESSEGKYELLGFRIEDQGKIYFAIAKAYDRSGITWIQNLSWIILISYFVSIVFIILISRYIAGMVTKPITDFTHEIDMISPDSLSTRIKAQNGNDEIAFLTNKFNRMLERVENAFAFQHNFIQHLSHELKTPLAVMLANAERSLTENNAEKLHESLSFQRMAIMELSGVINALMEISRSENTDNTYQQDTLRVDELLFECVEELNILNPDIQFVWDMDDGILDAGQLTLTGNSRILKLAFMNILKNASTFSKEHKPCIRFDKKDRMLILTFKNDGAIVDPGEQIHLFTHFFRGENSRNRKGFGLGLVLADRIFKQHNGNINYYINPEGWNCFEITLPVGTE